MATKKTVYEMTKEYYLKLWNADRIKALYEAGKLTEKEYNTLTNSKETKAE